MPYSDNLYSSLNEDSDGEEFTDQLSPSDGQFPPASSNETPHVPNVLIPDPTLQETTANKSGSKAQEAGKDSLLNSQAHPAESSFEPSGRQEQAATATSPLLPHQQRGITHSPSSPSHSLRQVLANRLWSSPVYPDAPPAYSPSPVSPFSPTVPGNPQQQERQSNYSTFGTSHMMGGPERGPTRARRRLPAWLNWKYGLIALAVLIAAIVFLGGISFTSSHPNHDNDQTTPAEPIEKEPEAQVPGDPESPGTPDQETFCQGQQYSYDDQILTLDFDKSRNLSFKETKYKHSGSSSVRVGGYVHVRRLRNGDGDPRMELDIVTNEPNLHLFTTLDGEEQRAKVALPEAYDSTVPGQRPCVEVKGTIWVPKNAEIGVVSVDTIHLPILLLDDLSLRVAEYTELTSIVGDIKAAASEPLPGEGAVGVSITNPDYTFIPAKDTWAFDSRIIEVHTTSGSIDGNYPLYDMLGLHTTSGSIQVSVTPHEELEGHPKPAVLSLSTISGSISAAEPIHELSLMPQRDYLVDVSTTSGSVTNALAFSAGLTVHSTASTLGLDLLPVINIDKITSRNPAQLETVTTSGSIAARVLEPMFYDGNGKAVASQVLDCLDAKHKSTSGGIGLRYPQSWEGTLDVKTTSGSIKARGKDLKIIKSSRGFPGSMMEARKGAEGQKSTIEARAHFGSLDVLVGDEA
ncbi:hypothetical protein NPX13_g923 [Xylaria arbuscula]|uniref:Adhesin domain-containing protein n=1 Tax=Xylaria arbuscula TaxID=114810 RepID=A0A9W8NMM1_9PEZI|nr:hypothetical protein NPX13_g923 [Xylaria arbuscula]